MTAIQFVHLAPAIEVLESVTLWGTRVYAIGSEIFTVTAMLWCLNFMANLTQKIYEFGYATGNFYRRHLHTNFKTFVIGVIALSILLGQYFIEGCKVVYTNRNEILNSANDIRNKVGSYFVYAAGVTGTHPVVFLTLPGYSFIKFKKHMDFDTFDTDVWAEINDMPGEIYDIEEEKFDVQEYINGNTDYGN